MTRLSSDSNIPFKTEQSSEIASNGMYIALGLEVEDAGYPVMMHAVEQLGERISLTASLWYLSTNYTLDTVFAQLNASMLDRRIDSCSSLVILDPGQGHAKWHLPQPLSDLMCAHWDYENNIFITFSLNIPSSNQKLLAQCITGQGVWTPLTKNTWYLSTSISTREVFKAILDSVHTGDQLCVFDSGGHVAFWQDGLHTPSILAPGYRSFRESALTEA